MTKQRKFLETTLTTGSPVACFIADDGRFGAAYLSSDELAWLDEYLHHWREIDAELRRDDEPEPTPVPTSRADDVALVAQIAAALWEPGDTRRVLVVESARELIREAERQIGGER